MNEIALGRLDDLPDGEGTQVEAGGLTLAVVRLGDAVYVIGDRCTHAEASLAEGEVDAEALTIECWRHGSAFSLVSGEPDAFPATKPTAVYDARVEDGDVIVKISPNEGGS